MYLATCYCNGPISMEVEVSSLKELSKRERTEAINLGLCDADVILGIDSRDMDEAELVEYLELNGWKVVDFGTVVEGDWTIWSDGV